MIKLFENIYSVGVKDSDVRIFHGYQTPVGTTYNSYFVKDDKNILIDFVKESFSEKFIENIEEVLGDELIDIIICNHVEPDHSGALPKVMKKYPNAVIYGTAACEKELNAYYPDSKFEFHTVKAKETLSTQNHTFEFIPMPMVHWPDSMSTYLKEEKILFSNDAMGQHIGTGEILDTDMTCEKLIARVADYYANIVLPFGLQVQKLINSLDGHEIKMICPSHGVILTDTIGEIIKKYNLWSQGSVNEDKVLIVYDTMWGTTAKMAKVLEQDYLEKGMEVKIINLQNTHYSHAMSEVLEAKYVLVGSPTLNNEMLPSVSAFLTYMKGLKPKNKIGQAFGSFGWSGESIAKIENILADSGFSVLPSYRAKWNI